MTKQARWVCPRCRSGKLAPTKPRRDDSRRYCFSCSEKTGRLVLREAPALEKQRTERAEARKARAALAAEKQAARLTARYTVAGLDLREEMAAMLKCAAFDAIDKKRPVALDVRRCRKKPDRRGVAHYRDRRIHINDFPGITANEVREVLLHELAHIATPGDGHGIAWKTVFRNGCEQYLNVRPRVENRYLGEVTKKLAACDGKKKQSNDPVAPNEPNMNITPNEPNMDMNDYEDARVREAILGAPDPRLLADDAEES